MKAKWLPVLTIGCVFTFGAPSPAEPVEVRKIAAGLDFEFLHADIGLLWSEVAPSESVSLHGSFTLFGPTQNVGRAVIVKVVKVRNGREIIYNSGVVPIRYWDGQATFEGALTAPRHAGDYNVVFSIHGSRAPAETRLVVTD